MLLNIYNARIASTAKIYPAQNGNSALVEKPCFVSIHFYNPQNNAVVFYYLHFTDQ